MYLQRQTNNLWKKSQGLLPRGFQTPLIRPSVVPVWIARPMPSPQPVIIQELRPPVQIPNPPVHLFLPLQPPVQILLPDPPVPPVVETLEPTLTDDSSIDQIMSSVFGDCSQQGILAPPAHTQ
ncbi:hypothetical protein TNCV_4489111 [Trichonephila clavipes]|nr:hypothetical protein TNCV_4489111 [Trichonephila clavipes]